MLHGVAGVVGYALGPRLGRSVLLVAAVPMAVTFVFLLANSRGIVDGDPVTASVTWVPQLDLAIDLRLDGLGLVMALLIAGVGTLVCLYGLRYFGPSTAGMGRLAGPLALFAGAMFGLVVSNHLLTLFVFWELTTVTSYLLIGWDDRSARSRAAALQAILVTGSGGLALLAGLVLIGEAAGTYSLSDVLADPPSGTTVTVGLVLVLLGAFTKSAQVPFSFWLPGAMAAPTPISAYLHSATMVKAGVFLIARFAPAFADVGLWRPAVLTVGLTTMLLGGIRALRQVDLKLLLAYGTVSQLGFLVVLFGAGLPVATEAGCTLLLAHGLFKAALFMVVGIIDHQAHTRDLRALRGLGPGWTATTVVAVASAASMAGIPLLFGFVAKELAYEAFTQAGRAWGWVVLVGLVAGSALTVAYSARFLWGAFWPDKPHGEDDPGPVGAVAPPAATFVAPAAVLTALTVLLGLAPSLADGVVGAAAKAADPLVETVHLALWHGFTTPLYLSILTVVLGATLFALRSPVGRLLGASPALPSGTTVYSASLRGLNKTADRVTSIVQNGSLPVYAGVILLVAAVLPGAVLVSQASWPGFPQLVETPGQVAVAAVMLAGAVAAAALRRRFAAALCLGAVGYGMGVLFVIQGAPDLALTQFAIETLSVVLFVLVLRFLPDHFDHQAPAGTRAFRVVVAAAVGISVTVFSIIAAGARTAPAISNELVERSLPEGGGRNVVNVILVDFRGLDTLGEITVLTVAAVGALSLAFGGRVTARRSRDGRRAP